MANPASTLGCGFDDGLVTAPALTFQKETGTGFYRVSAGVIGVAVGGVKVAHFDNTGLVTPGATTEVNVIYDATAETTGNVIDVQNLAAITTGKVLNIPATGATLTTGILVNVSSDATAMTGAGRLIFSNHTGVSGTSAILNEFKSAAADETEIVKITATAALALGTALDVSVAAMTTGTGVKITPTALTTGKALDISSADALTTGNLISVVSNSADTTARSLVKIANSNALATGATALEVNNGSTGAAIKITGNVAQTGIDFTAIDATHPIFNATAASGSTAAPQTNAPTGFIKIKVAGVDQWIPYYSAT